MNCQGNLKLFETQEQQFILKIVKYKSVNIH